jgi:hypothetical protein
VVAGAATAAGAATSSLPDFSVLLQATIASTLKIIVNELASNLRCIAELRDCGSGIIANNA